MRRKRWLFLILIFFFLLFLGIELYLPSIANRTIENIFEEETDEIEDLEINVSSFPALKILLGRVDHASIRAQGLTHDHLYLEQFNLNYSNIVLNKNGFHGINTYLEAMVTEEALNKYLKEKYPEMGNFSVQINPEQILLQGELNIFDIGINFS